MSSEYRPSGRRERVLITCSTFEVAKIVEPARFYDATRVYIIHYGNREVYREFYDEVKRQLEEWKPDLDIVEDYDKDPVYDFTKMMKAIMTIIGKEKKAEEAPDIFVNISSGTHEFTAAAVMASMMWDDVVAFTTPTDQYTVSDDRMKEVYYDKETNRPIGLARTTKKPIKVSGFSVPKPDKKLVVALGMLDYRIDKKLPISAPYMINALSDKGLMTDAEFEGVVGKDKIPKPKQKTIMSYQRNFIDKWLDNGWVDRASKRDLSITAEGRQILETFLSCYSV